MQNPKDKELAKEYLKELNIPDAEYWSEKEGEPYFGAVVASFRFVRPLQKSLDRFSDDHEEWIKKTIEQGNTPYSNVIKEMNDAGISSKSIGELAYWISRMSMNQVLYRFSDPAGSDYDLPNEGEHLPRWVLKETVKENSGYEINETGDFLMDMHSIFPYRNQE